MVSAAASRPRFLHVHSTDRHRVEAPQPASSPSVRSRRAGPAPQASDKDNNDKDWLIAYHVEQMTHDAKKHKQVRDKERAKRNERNVIHNSSLNEHRRQRGLPPSPLSRSDGDSQ
jgi:hypothetical protein